MHSFDHRSWNLCLLVHLLATCNCEIIQSTQYQPTSLDAPPLNICILQIPCSYLVNTLQKLHIVVHFLARYTNISSWVISCSNLIVGVASTLCTVFPYDCLLQSAVVVGNSPQIIFGCHSYMVYQLSSESLNSVVQIQWY